MDVVQISKLTKYYGKARGIIDLDLSVTEGEFFGFIGPNGAGKSTTIRTLLGLIQPTSGQASIFGLDICRDKTKILSDVGYLPSESVFYPGMKVKEILKLSADLRKKDCSAEIEELCERLQLDENRKADELSFGNRKKVAIVSALLHNPRLLILDEPTSGLDPLMQREFFRIIRERNARGTTVFLSSHVLSEIQRNCTRAAIIREGRLIACDRVEALSKTSAKRITLHGQAPLNQLNGVRDLKEADGAFSFLYHGEILQLLQVLSSGTITDLSISEPDLEEIFLHYYESGKEQL
ncbi:MAG: ATP-binding cassette domain-containing protein [Fusicatenibacter sp.]